MHTQNKITAAGHTAGPWKAIGGRVDGPDCYPAPILIATCSLTHKVGENEANARLISAAPGLLEALEAICARIHGDFDHPALAAFGPLLNTEADIMSIASTALARAKGVQS